MDFLEVSPHKTADQTPDKVQAKTLSETLIPELEDGIRWRHLRPVNSGGGSS